LSLPKELRLIVFEAIPVVGRSATINLNSGPITVSVIGGPVALLATCRQIHKEALPILRPQLEALKPTKLLMKLPYDGLPSYRYFVRCRREVEPLLEHLYKCAWNAGCKETHDDDLPLPVAFQELARTDSAFVRTFVRQSGIILRKESKESARISFGLNCVEGAKLVGYFPSTKFNADFYLPRRFIEDDNLHYTRAADEFEQYYEG
jgi:hypothetical protein